MKTSLRYGGGVLTFEVPGNTVFLQIREPEYTINKESFCTNFLFRLSASERDLSKVGIVVSDKTRLCGYPNYLPWIVEMAFCRQAPEGEHFLLYCIRYTSQADGRRKCECLRKDLL